MSKPIVLLVDYEPKSLEATQATFAAAGYRVEVARDGLAGIEAFHRVEPDLVLLGALLPKKHGFEVCQQLRATPAGKRTPILILGGAATGVRDRLKAVTEYGASQFITRPVTDQKLLAICGSLLAPAAAAATAAADGPEASDARDVVHAGPEELSEDEIMAQLEAVLPNTPAIPVVPLLTEAAAPAPLSAARPFQLEKVTAVAQAAKVNVVHPPTHEPPTPAGGRWRGGLAVTALGAVAIVGLAITWTRPHTGITPPVHEERPTPVNPSPVVAAAQPNQDNAWFAAPPFPPGTKLPGATAASRPAPDPVVPVVPEPARHARNAQQVARVEPVAEQEGASADAPEPGAVAAESTGPDPRSAGAPAGTASFLALRGIPSQAVPEPRIDSLSVAAHDPPATPAMEGIQAAQAEPATPSVLPGSLLDLAQVDTTPVIQNRPKPVYPPSALRSRREGEVLLRVLVDEGGKVAGVEIVQSRAGADLLQAAVKAARGWTYRPAEKDGVLVKVWILEKVAFRL